MADAAPALSRPVPPSGWAFLGCAGETIAVGRVRDSMRAARALIEANGGSCAETSTWQATGTVRQSTRSVMRSPADALLGHAPLAKSSGDRRYVDDVIHRRIA